MVRRRAGEAILVVLVTAACASAGPGPARPRTDRVGPAFGDVRTFAVFRPRDEARRGKDVLDGVAASLARRGWTVVGEPPAPGAAGPLEELRGRLDPWMGPALDARSGVVFGVAEGAGELVRAAGLDAVVFAYRFVRMPTAGPTDRPGGAGPGEVRTTAAGAIVLVSARDEVARVEWGGETDVDLARGPANAAEAIDALLTALDAEREQEPPPGEGPPPVVSPGAASGQAR